MLTALILLAVLFASGAPIAYCLSRDHGEWVRFTFESLAIGLLAQMTIGIVAVRSRHYSLGLVGTLTCAMVVTGSVVAWRRGIRGRPRVDLPLLLAAAGFVAVGLRLRLHPSYFAFSVGDMGGYINAANAIAAGRSVGNRPQGFTVFLAGTNAFLGPAHTVSGLPVIGIVLMLGTIALGKLVGLRTAAVAIVALIMAVHPVTVWFSLFPVAETLHAPLLIAAIYFLVRARSAGSRSYAVVSGLFVGSLLFVRISAVLLPPLLFVVLLASAVADDDVRYRIQRLCTCVALALLALALVYDLQYTNRYVRVQFHGKLVPEFAFDAADRWGLLRVSVPLLLTLAVLFALVLGAAHLVRSARPRRIRLPATGFWRVATASVVGFGIVGWALSSHGGLDDALARWSPALLLLIAAGTILVVVRPGRYLDGATGLLVVSVVATYSLVFAGRIRHARGALYFLYWDRYLYSAVLPLALLLLAIAVHVLLRMCTDSTRGSPGALRALAAVGLIALTGLAVIPPALETRNTGIARQALYGDVYGTLRELDRLTRSEGVQPIVYSGMLPVPPGWFFPNTKNAFARPLGLSFGRVILEKSFRSNTLDRVYTSHGARTTLADAGYSTGYLIQLRPGFTRRRYEDADARYLGTVASQVPILRRSLDPWSERFRVVDLRFDVYALHEPVSRVSRDRPRTTAPSPVPKVRPGRNGA
jgi:hypothetical protein